MTKIKFCGLSDPGDILAANQLKADYVGFVFAPGSRRRIGREEAERLKKLLDPGISAAGVFTDEEPEYIAGLLNRGVIDIAQLHGSEDEDYIRRLRTLTGKPIIQAFRIRTAADVSDAVRSPADYILLDSGAGTGNLFDWRLIQDVKRPYFLAGGLRPENAGDAVKRFHPFALDVSSGIETGGRKDKRKMTAFAAAVRKEERR